MSPVPGVRGAGSPAGNGTGVAGGGPDGSGPAAEAPSPEPASPAVPGGRSWARRAAHALWAVAPAWLTARAVVVGMLGAAWIAVGHVHASPATVARVHQGLLGWDAGWYEAIARLGYTPLGHQALRFFPLFPLAGRALALVPGISAGVALVVVANGCALVGTALLRVLVLRETGDARWAHRTMWLFSLAPPAYVLVMGYAEGLLLLCTVGCFVALRGRAVPGRAARSAPRWGWVAALGFAAGLTRPLGVVLALPAAVEAVRGWRGPGAGWRRRAGAVAGVLAPVAGAGAFLVWTAATFGDGLLPVRVQLQAGHHGGLSDPFRVLGRDAMGVLHDHVGTALHIPWVILAVALLVVCWRRLPAAYGAFATGVLLVALSGTNLDSFERYALSAFPLAIAGAALLGRRWVERAILGVAAAGLGAYALLAFLNVVVP